jgi:hypothetical protein
MDDVIKNPTKEQIAMLIKMDVQGAAKWLKDPDTGNIYYWSAGNHQHMEVAYWLKLRGYTKGIVLEDEKEITTATRQHWETDLER